MTLHSQCPKCGAELQCTVTCYGRDVQYDDATHTITHYRVATELYEPDELLPGDSHNPRIYCANDHDVLAILNNPKAKP